MSDIITIKQLSQELGVSEQALRQWCKKNNIRKERIQGTKPCYIIDLDTEKQIKTYYSNESNETKKKSIERKEENQNNESNETKESIKVANVSQPLMDDLQKEYIETLKAQIALLSEQLNVKDNQINILTTEIEQERKERQTILMELLSLRGQPKITTVTASDTKSNTESRVTRQVKSIPKRRRTLSERIRDFFK